jgi:hypothetical protein
MILFFFLLLQLLTYFAAAFPIFAITSARNGSKNFLRAPLLLSLVAGPILLAWILEMSMFCAPGLRGTFYLIVTLTIFLVPGFFLRRHFRNFLNGIFNLLHSCRSLLKNLSLAEGVLALTTLGLLLITVAAAFFFPLTGNDTLEYLQTAKIIFGLKDVSHYPFVNTELTQGYFGPWSHPLGYINLFVWGFLLLGSAGSAILAKGVASYYVFLTVLTVWEILGFKEKFSCWMAALMTIGIPLYFSVAVLCHIDPIRICAWASFFLALSLFLQAADYRKAVLAGLSMGAALYTHSLSILLIPMVLPLAVLHFATLRSSKRFRSNLGYWAVIFSLGLIPALRQYAINLKVFGSLVADTGAVSVYAIPHLFYDQHFLWTRNLATSQGLRQHAFFPGWTQLANFSLSYWFLLLSLGPGYLYLKSKSKLKPQTLIPKVLSSTTGVLALMLILFFLGTWLSVILKDYGLVRNVRYLLTVQPLVGVLGAVLLGSALKKLPRKMGGGAALFLAILIASQTIKGPVKSALSQFRRHGGKRILTFSMEAEKLQQSRSPQGEVLRFVSAHLSSHDKFLTFRQSEMAYYFKIPFFSHLDPRVSLLYYAKDASELSLELEKLGITHLYLPARFEPVIYRTAINELLLDPLRAQLLFSNSHYRIVKLLKRSISKNLDCLSVSDSFSDHRGRKFPSRAFFLLPESQDFLNNISSGIEPQQLLLRGEAVGKGRLKILLSQSGASGKGRPTSAFLWEGLLNPNERQNFGGLYLQKNQQQSSFEIQYQGTQRLQLSNLSLCRTE